MGHIVELGIGGVAHAVPIGHRELSLHPLGAIEAKGSDGLSLGREPHGAEGTEQYEEGLFHLLYIDLVSES